MKRAYRISDRIRARVSPGTTAGRVARSSFWSLAGSFCVQALTLVAIALAARILGPDGLGRFSLLQATMTMFVGLVGMGMAMTATKFISEFRRNDPDRAGRMLGMCLLTAPAASVVLAGGLLLASDLIAQPLLGSETLKLGLQLGCLYLVGSLLKAIQIAALAGLEAFGSIAGANVCRGLATIPLILGGAYLAGANGAMGGLALLSLLDALFSGWLLIRQCRRQSIPLRCLPRREDVILAVRFSLPMVISTAVVNSTLWAVQLILSARGSFAELGIFTAAGRFLAMILMIEAPVGAVLLPLLSSRGKDCSSRLNKASITVSWALGVCPAALLICLPEIMGLLVGSAFATLQARRTLIVAMAYCTIQLYKQGLRRILVTRSKMWYSLLDNAIWAVVLLPAAWLLTPMGATGMAGAFLIAYASTMLVIVPLYHRLGMMPAAVLISGESMAIWLAVAVGATISWFAPPLALRLCLLVCMGGAFGVGFVRMLAGKAGATTPATRPGPQALPEVRRCA